ncbi:hypothetical protein [Burkholderia cepacia]|uniref:hypothetical protein n=1 Tax=Burkholderia cepacia TaxID=292 RepID=UPI003528ABA4
MARSNDARPQIHTNQHQANEPHGKRQRIVAPTASDRYFQRRTHIAHFVIELITRHALDPQGCLRGGY